MSVDMSFVNPFNLSFEPNTLSACDYDLSFVEPSYLDSSYDRAGSHCSQSTTQSQSPEPQVQLPILDDAYIVPRRQLATPRRTPIRSHGPLLLPKIRNQDQLDAPSPPVQSRKRLRSPTEESPSVVSQAKRVKNLSQGGWKPGHARSFTNPETTYVPAVTPSHSRNNSTLCSPISMVGNSIDAQLSNMSSYRRASSVSSAGLDSSTLSKFGYPTYRATPTYVASSGGIETFVPAYTLPPREPSPLCNQPTFDEYVEDDFTYAENLALDFETTPLPLQDEPTTTLQAYLTSPNPSPSLVRQLNIQHREPGAKSFWWDVRQVRPWASFNMQTFNSIPGLSDLLNVSVPQSTLTNPPTLRNAQPETETDLLRLYNSFYASKLNAALAVGTGSRHLAMKTVTPSASNSANEAHFISNYTDDTSFLVLNRPSARVVGLVLSFDRWNSSMRVDGNNNNKVNYLRGLAKLHGVMRDYGCRYGFIMTEIELLVVRNGSDSTPNFGFLEVQSIPLANASPDSRSSSVDSTGEDGKQEQKMTAMTALFFLNMLAKDVPLPNQPSWQSAIGAPAEGTRRKCLGKDTWIPEPQLAEKREAKRARGWVWPEEAVGRKELGRKGIRYAKC